MSFRVLQKHSCNLYIIWMNKQRIT